MKLITYNDMTPNIFLLQSLEHMANLTIQSVVITESNMSKTKHQKAPSKARFEAIFNSLRPSDAYMHQ